MTGREVSDAEMLAALLPRDLSDLQHSATPAMVVAHPAPVQLTVEYRPGPDGTLVPVYVPAVASTVAVRNAGVAPTATAVAQPIPSWAKGVAVVAVGVGAGGWLLAGAIGVVSSAVAGLAAGAATVLPFLVLAGVAVAAMASRRGGGKGNSPVNVSQSVVTTLTQTISNNVKIGD